MNQGEPLDFIHRTLLRALVFVKIIYVVGLAAFGAAGGDQGSGLKGSAFMRFDLGTYN
jgi:hypothetical protein